MIYVGKICSFIIVIVVVPESLTADRGKKGFQRPSFTCVRFES